MSATTQHFFRRNTRPGNPDSPPARLWIDLDNSPHVPFFAPLIKALEARKLRVCLTAREAYQVEDLLALHHLACPLIGRHYGQNRVMKLAGLLIRSVQLMQVARRLKPTLAVSHGSRVPEPVRNHCCRNRGHPASTGLRSPLPRCRRGSSV